MWFCCQLWQCNLRACLGPLDVWKAWNGWSHVVHPCRAPAAPTTFLDARARDESEKAAATSSLTTGSTKTTPSGSRHISHFAQRELCEVAVEIHQHEGRPSSSGASLDDGSSGGGGGGAALGASGGGGGGGGGARSASDSVAGTATTASVAGSSAASVTSDASSLSGASVASGTGSSGSSAGVDAPLELRAGHGSAFGARAKTGAGAARPQHPLEFTGMTSPLGVLVEWEAEDEEDEDEELGGDAEDLTPSPQRPPSTDWTTLESNLDFWRQEHTRRPPRSDEDERSSKVRYNDTGSLEEVNLEQMVEYYVDDDLSLSPEVDHESLRMQYRQIWELRATLEEDEDLSDPGIITTKAASDTEMESQISRSSPDQSPEMEMPTSHTTSFESNTEPLLEEAGGLWACAAAAAAAAAAGAAQATGAGAGTSAALQLPSYESRRQTYRNVLSWRLRHLESRRHQVATAAVAEAGSAAANSAATAAAAAVAASATAAATASSGRQPSLEDTSFDSVETADTEGSSTDASRLEQATTSFESTTDNTDSAGDSQAHRLQQLRADSGYRSLENPPAAPPKLSRRQLPLADSTDLDAPPRDADAKLLWLASLGDSGVGDSAGLAPGAKGSLGGVRARRLALGDSGEPDHDEGVAELQSPPHPDQPAPWDGRRKACTRSASKKRREFGGGSGSCGVTGSAAADAIVAADVEPPPPPPAQPHLHRCHAVYTRDYSVDEKSDALFREFSRCDPTQQPELLPRGQRLGGPGAYRRHSHAHAHHSRHGHYAAAAAAAGAYPYARAEAAVRKASAAAVPVSASTAAAAPALALGAVPGVAAVAVAVVAAPAAAPAPDKTFAGPGAATVTAMRHDVLTAALPVIRVADEDAADHV